MCLSLLHDAACAAAASWVYSNKLSSPCLLLAGSRRREGMWPGLQCAPHSPYGCVAAHHIGLLGTQVLQACRQVPRRHPVWLQLQEQQAVHSCSSRRGRGRVRLQSVSGLVISPHTSPAGACAGQPTAHNAGGQACLHACLQQWQDFAAHWRHMLRLCAPGCVTAVAAQLSWRAGSPSA